MAAATSKRNTTPASSRPRDKSSGGSSSSSSSPLSWDDLRSLHASSSVGCTPSSLHSLVDWIALEGGKHGCDAQHVRTIVARHSAAKARTGELDMDTMEYWWTHLRHHPALSFYERDSTDASSSSSPSPLPPARTAAEQRLYTRINDIKSNQSMQLTEDGVLFAPFGRSALPPSSLSLPFSTVRQRHPSMLAVAAESLRQAVLGWSDAASAMSSELSSSFSFVAPATSSSSSAVGDEGRDEAASSFLHWQAYCCAETIGKASYTGLLQHELTQLLGITANNLHPVLNALRARGLLITVLDRSKNRLFLRQYKHGGDAQRAVVDERRERFQEWYDSHHALWKSKTVRRAARRAEQKGDEAEDDGSAIFADEYNWNFHPAPSFSLSLSVTSQLYRLIADSGTEGITVAGLRARLGGMGLKAFERVVAAITGDDGFGVVSVADREGKTYVYRLLTRQAWRQRQLEGDGVDERKGDVIELDADADVKPERKEGEEKRGADVEAQPEPAKGIKDEQDVVEEEKRPSSAAGAKASQTRATPLLVFQRRRTALALLSQAPYRVLSSTSLMRSLAERHPPVMTARTARAFFSVMANEGLVRLYNFEFPLASGRGSSSVTVVRGLRRPPEMKQADERLQPADDDDMEDDEQEETIRSRAYDVATQQRNESRNVGIKLKYEDDGRDELLAARSDAEEREDETLRERKVRKDVERALKQRKEADRAAAERSKITYVGFTPESMQVVCARVLCGFIRPLLARCHYLHSVLWSSYRLDDNAVVTASSMSSSSSSSATLWSFSYTELVRRLYLRDYLLVAGVGMKDISGAPFVTDQTLLDKRIDELPEHVLHALNITSQEEYHRLHYLHKCLAVLQQLQLIVPLLDGQPAPTSGADVASSSSFGSVHSAYSLTPAFRSPLRTFDFTSPAAVPEYWQHMRSQVTQGADPPSVCAELSISAPLYDWMKRQQRWRYKAVRTASQTAQLVYFERSASSGSGMTTDAIMRAAKVTKMASLSAAAFYFRRLFPQLAALHDDVGAFEDTVRREPEHRDGGERKTKKAKTVKAGRRKRGKRKKGRAVEEEVEARPAIAPANPEQGEPAADGEAVSTAEAAVMSRKRAPRSKPIWLPQEDEQLVVLYNQWLQQQDILPLVYRAPPHADLAADDGLGMDVNPPVSSSLSVFTASFHTLLPLMVIVARPQLPELSAQSSPVLSSDAAPVSPVIVPSASDSIVSANIQELSEHVLHNKPLPPPADSNGDAAQLDVREDEEKSVPPEESKPDDKQDGEDEADEVQSSSSLLSSIASFVAANWRLGDKIKPRDLASVRRRLEIFRTRLGLPVLGSASFFASSLSAAGAVSAASPVSPWSSPLLSSLTSMIKQIVLEPAESYSSALVHAAMSRYTDPQIDAALAMLRAERWLVRKKRNAAGADRSWKITATTEDIMHGRAPAAEPQRDSNAAHEKDILKGRWRQAGWGEKIHLPGPVTRLQVEAVAEAISAGDVDLLPAPKPLDLQDQPADEQQAEEAVEPADAVMEEEAQDGVERKEEGEKKKKTANVIRIIKTALDKHAARIAAVDLEGDGVRLVCTHWPLLPERTQGAAEDAMDVNVEAVEEQQDDNIVSRVTRARKRMKPTESAATVGADSGRVAAVGALEQLGAAGEEQQVGAEMEYAMVHLLSKRNDAKAIPQLEDDGALTAALDSADTVRLSDQIAQLLLDAGNAGLTVKEIKERLGEPTSEEDDGRRLDLAQPPALSSLFSGGLHRSLSCGIVARVFSRSHHRLVHESFMPFHAITPPMPLSSSAQDGGCAVVSHSWRLLDGSVNEAVWHGLYDGVLRSVRQWPGVTEERLAQLFPPLTAMELQHVLEVLVMDDAVTRRWLVEQDERSVCYFPVTEHYGR